MTDESACVSEGVREEDNGKAKTEMKQTINNKLFYFLIESCKGHFNGKSSMFFPL